MVTTAPGNSDQNKINQYKAKRDALFSKLTPEERNEFNSHHKDPLNGSFQNTHSYTDLQTYLKQMFQFAAQKNKNDSRRLNLWDDFVKTGGGLMDIFTGGNTTTDRNVNVAGGSLDNIHLSGTVHGTAKYMCPMATEMVRLFKGTTLTSKFTKQKDRKYKGSTIEDRFKKGSQYISHVEQAIITQKTMMNLLSFYDDNLKTNSYNPQSHPIPMKTNPDPNSTLDFFKNTMEKLYFKIEIEKGIQKYRLETKPDVYRYVTSNIKSILSPETNLSSQLLQIYTQNRNNKNFNDYFKSKMGKPMHETIDGIKSKPMNDIYATYFHVMKIAHDFLTNSPKPEQKPESKPEPKPEKTKPKLTSTKEERMKRKWYNDKEFYVAPDKQKGILKRNKFYNIDVLVSREAYVSPKMRRRYISGMRRIYNDTNTVIYRKGSMMMFGYKGTDKYSEIYEDMHIVVNALHKTGMHEKDKKIFEKLYKSYKPKTIRFVGHSLGGSRAALMSKIYKFPGSGFATGYSPIPTPVLVEPFNGDKLPFFIPRKHSFNYYTASDYDVLSNAAKDAEKGVNNLEVIETLPVSWKSHYIVNYIPRRFWNKEDIKAKDNNIQQYYVNYDTSTTSDITDYF